MDSRRCIELTAAGVPCRAWAVRDSVRPLCSAHLGRNEGAGAPVGNVNARKHGFYEALYSDDAVADLVNLGTDLSLLDEIALARVQLRRVKVRMDEGVDLEDFVLLSDLAFRGLGRIGRLVVEQKRLGGVGSFEDLMGEVLDGLDGWEGL